MNPSPKNGVLSKFDRVKIGTGEETLRLIARLPAPEGLVERVQSGLENAPRSGRVLNWPGPLKPAGSWMQGTIARGAAAAAIVCVVAGGGWTIYSRVSPAPGARVVIMPLREGAGGGFSPAGAKRVPQTLEGPVLTHPVTNPVEEPVVDKVPAAPRRDQGKAVPAKKKAAPKSPGARIP